MRSGPAGVARTLQLDHMAIFVLIAGTYTPFCLLALHGPWRWGLLGTVWALAAGGIALKVGWMGAPVWLSTGIYVAMGWLVQEIQRQPTAGIVQTAVIGSLLDRA